MDGNLGFINNQIWMKIRENMDGFVLFIQKREMNCQKKTEPIFTP